MNKQYRQTSYLLTHSLFYISLSVVFAIVFSSISVNPISESYGQTPGCGEQIPAITNYLDYEDTNLNFKIKYPEEFPKKHDDPQFLKPAVYFDFSIPPDPNCSSDLSAHPALVTLNVYVRGSETLADIRNFVLGKWMYDTFFQDNTYFVSLIEGDKTTTQGNRAYFTTYYVKNSANDQSYKVLNFFTIVEGHIYLLSYFVNQLDYLVSSKLHPDHFDIYYQYKVQKMFDSLCFPKNSEATNQCLTESPPTPTPTPTPNSTTQKSVTEEWILEEYKDVPNFPSIYKCTTKSGSYV